MLLTEEEAKTKWCPHAVASHTDPRRGFRPDDDEHAKAAPTHPCIGSACMAWRWTNKRSGAPENETFVPVGCADNLPDPKPGYRWFSGSKDADGMVPWAQFAMCGYCGLAGKVEP